MGPQGAAISREENKVENKEVRILVVDDEPTMADSLRQNFVEDFGRAVFPEHGEYLVQVDFRPLHTQDLARTCGGENANL